MAGFIRIKKFVLFAIASVDSRSKPLALYTFSKDKGVQQQIFLNTSSGEVGINDTVMQIGN